MDHVCYPWPGAQAGAPSSRWSPKQMGLSHAVAGSNPRHRFGFYSLVLVSGLPMLRLSRMRTVVLSLIGASSGPRRNGWM